VVTQRVLKTASISAQRVSSRDGDWSLIHFIPRLTHALMAARVPYKTMHAAMIMDAAMIANAFPLMPQRHAAASAALSFDLKDMRLLPPLVIRADERRRVKAVRQSLAATQTAA
jgi:hypothetical protein